jgi:peroxiredoxin
MLFVLLLLVGISWAQEPTKRPTPPPGSHPRSLPIQPDAVEPRIPSQLYVGEPAPDFELDGSQGRPVRLADLKGYWVVLVFADSRAKLPDLKGCKEGFTKLGVRAYAVCHEGVGALKSYAKREKTPCVLLSDVTGEISQLYGLYDYRRESILPGFVLLDRQSVVRTAVLGQSLGTDELLEAVERSMTDL